MTQAPPEPTVLQHAPTPEPAALAAPSDEATEPTPQTPPSPAGTQPASAAPLPSGQALSWTPPATPRAPRPSQRRATQPTRYQTQLYLTVQPGQKLAHAIVVRGHSAHAYTTTLTGTNPADEALIALVNRCRAGDNIQLYTTQPEVRAAVNSPSRALRRALDDRSRSLTLKRTVTPRSALWADMLHLQTGGHLDRGLLPNQYHLYLSAITDGRSTYVGAVLHGSGQLSLHSRTLGDTDLSTAELKAVQWAAAELPTHVRLDIHASAATTRILTETTPEPVTPDTPGTVRTVSTIAKAVTDKHINPFVHVQPHEPTGNDCADTLARHARGNACSQFI